MVAPPTLLRNVDLLPDFYRAVGADAELPLIVQDEPAATGVTVPISILLDSLAASGARTVKLEPADSAERSGRLWPPTRASRCSAASAERPRVG